MYTQFQRYYYYRNISEPALSTVEFMKYTPLVIIDCSHQQERLKRGAVEIRLEFECTNNIPDKTTGYCLILHNRSVRYNPLTGAVEVQS